jgi:hypothetical protein
MIKMRVKKVPKERDPWLVGRYDDEVFQGGIHYATWDEAIVAAVRWHRNLHRRSRPPVQEGRIYKHSPLNLPDHVAQAVYRGDLILSDSGLVWDVKVQDWFDPDSW